MYPTIGRTISLWGEEINPESTAYVRAAVGELLATEPEEWITLEVFSPGGDWISGIALYDWLRLNVPKLQTVGYSLVGSMAVIVFLAGQHRVGIGNCNFIIHPVRDYQDKPTARTANDYRVIMKTVQTTSNSYIDVLMSRMDRPPDRKEIVAAMAVETVIKPAKAKKWGLVHEVIKP